MTEGQLPAWVASVAQLFLGSGIGARFAGLRRNVVLRAMALCSVTVSIMLALAILFAILLSPVVNVPPEVMTLAFAPAGLVEMSLIALTLGANPVFVTIHHVIRLLACVILMPQVFRMFVANRDEDK
jgi:membrane AbrB-like protein